MSVHRVSFNGYNHPIKTLWKKGKLKNVTHGLYAEKLDKKTLSADHLVPVSKGGKTTLGNIALASCYMNNLRSSRDLKEVVTEKMALDYIAQFANDTRKIVQQYVIEITKTLKQLGVLK